MKKLAIFVLSVFFLLPGHGFAKNETAATKNPSETESKNVATPTKKPLAPQGKNAPAKAASVRPTQRTSVTVEEQFKKNFPKNSFETITPTDIPDLYEVYTGHHIYYFMPKADVVFYGNLVSKSGTNITRESLFKKMAQKMAKVPLDNAFKIGNGKITVVEFMDPNCYHCQQAYKFLSQRNDVALNVFFLPLSKESGEKVKHILCSKDPLKTYDEVMNGKLDNNAPLSVCTDKKVEDTVKSHMQIVSQVGVRATPFFYIKGQMVEGFDPAVMEKILKE